MIRQISKLITICFFFQSCSKEKDMEIHKVGNLLFRNSYVSISDSSSNKKFDSIEKSNPEMIIDSIKDRCVIKKLEKVGIIRDNRLQLDKIKFKYAQITEDSKDSSNKFCRIYYNNKLANIILEVKANGKKANRILKNDGSHLQYETIDLVKGGFSEILVFDSYYVSNGDNYSLEIYEIK
ncbi:hypothetical protein OX284_005860 [Flavobacterium sp. SUN046]|uniref:hypothetical protein n=1 Tax=Flavobacterium sp. SUN046 TaxID=3002440 RepID=UPI002DBC68B5|nr:hypothetical protein [Flavobacterium sp. SUN046]MEC4048944.1 hypothetical protein [Flavobacterium sp. SUN046]